MGKFNIYFIHFKIKFNLEKCNISKCNLAVIVKMFLFISLEKYGTCDFKPPLIQRQIQYLL